MASIALLGLFLGCIVTDISSQETGVCPVGSDWQVDKCELCQVGFYRGETDAVCVACDDEVITSVRGAVSHNQCDKSIGSRNSCRSGHEWISSLEDCSVCPVGTYREFGVDYWCVDCTPGSTTAAEGATSADLCSVGLCLAGEQYVPASSQCEACNSGTFSTAASAIGCQPCPLGAITSAPRASSCQLCREGATTSRAGSTECELCPAGSFTDRPGAPVCQPCPRGSVSSQSGASRCEPCPRGSVTSEAGASECTACPAGWSTSASGASDCEACGEGFAATLGGSCVPCPLGFFTNQTGSTTCEPCPVGSTTTQIGSTTCEACGPGYFSESNGSSCLPCPSGSITNTTGASRCQPCPEGHATTQRAASVCHACLAGTFAPREGASACSPCPEGYIAADEGASQCSPCMAGSTASGESATRCTPCPAGSIAAQNGAHVCTPCPVGSTTDGEGSSECTTCPRGFFAADEGASICTPCTAGSFAADEGASICTPCTAGSFAADEGASFCLPCPKRYIAPMDGAAVCDPCPLGRTTAEPGASVCIVDGDAPFTLDNCPPGTEANATENVCRLCSRGYFSTTGSQTFCQACPSGTDSPREGATGSHMCLPQDKSNLLEGSMDVDDGVSCPTGSEYWDLDEGVPPACRPCPVGTYRDSQHMSYCTQCPNGGATQQSGAKTSSVCAVTDQAQGNGERFFIPDECPLGTNWDPAMERCTFCPYGSFRSHEHTLCVSCPANTTTPAFGATAADDCMLPKGTGATGHVPFITEDGCPSGSEWDYALTGCKPCPRNFHRERAPGSVHCSMCPASMITRTEGSLSSAACVQPEDRVAISHGGCPPGYYPDSASSSCTICPIGSFKATQGNSSCSSCPFTTEGSGDTARRGATSRQECRLQQVVITDLTPSQSARSGGITLLLTLTGGDGLRVLYVLVGGRPCRLQHNVITEGQIQCTLPPSVSLGESDVTIALEDGRAINATSRLLYVEDPVMYDVKRHRTIASGGIKLEVEGNHLTNAVKRELSLTTISPSRRAVSICSSGNEALMMCTTPNVSSWMPRREKRSDEEGPLPAYLGFYIDGVLAYRNVTNVMNEYGPIGVFPDPVITPFHDGVLRVPVPPTQIEFQGVHLDGGARLTDYGILLNSSLCQPSMLEANKLLCDVNPTDMARELDLNIPHTVTVQVGSLAYQPGFIVFYDPNNPTPDSLSTADPDTTSPKVERKQDIDDDDDDLIKFILIPVIVIAVLILLVVILVAVFAQRRKRRKKQEDDLMHRSTPSSSESPDSSFRNADSAALPPLPMGSVFGPGRITDHGVGMRTIALPGDNISTNVDNGKRMSLMPTESHFKSPVKT